jgi:hypothetical protein
MKAWKHFKTITKHRILVMRHCFAVGLYRQGLTHDLSKYSWTEFRVGAKYYSGDHSPNVEERNEYGYSAAWLHHKGRNKHHFEYWVDYRPGTRVYVPLEMPPRYLTEMCMDRIAACKTYNGAAYTDADPYNYLLRAQDTIAMNETTQAQLTFLLRLLAEQGEKTLFRFIREHVLTGEDFLADQPKAE